MTFVLTIILTLAAFVLILFNRGRLGGGVGICSVFLILSIGCGPVPSKLLRDLQSEYLKTRIPKEWGDRSAIVLLGMDTVQVGNEEFEASPLSYGRIVTAAAAYQSCEKKRAYCTVIVSGGDRLGSGATEAEVYTKVLESLGVPSDKVVAEGSSRNTWENAEYVSGMLKGSKYSEIYLLTSAVHMRRALLYFSHFGVHPHPVRTDYVDARLSAIPEAYNFALADLSISEYQGVARYYVYSWLGLNG